MLDQIYFVYCYVEASNAENHRNFVSKYQKFY